MTSAISTSANPRARADGHTAPGSSSRENRYEFVRVDGRSPHFARLKRIFNEKVAPSRGCQASQVQKIGEAREIKAEMLMRKGDPIGVLTYKVSGNRRNTFEVPAMLVLGEDKMRTDRWGKMLVDRAVKLAKRKNARHVDVGTFSGSAIKDVLSGNGFKVDQRKKNEHVRGVTEYLYTKRLESAEAVAERGRALIRGEEETNNSRGTSSRKKRERETTEANVRDSGGKRGATEATDGSRSVRGSQTKRVEARRGSAEFGSRRPRTEGSRSSYDDFKPYVRKGPRRNGGVRAARGPAPERTKHRITLMAKYLLQIQKKLKIIEGRINSGMMKGLKPGHEVTWYSRGLEVKTKIVAIRKYDSFRSMLAAEGVQNCLADVQDLEVGDMIYKRIPGYAARAAQHGVLAIQLQLV